MLVDHSQKTMKEYKNLKKHNTKYIFQNALDKVSFQHDKAYGDFKDLARRTQSDKVSRDKAFKIASDPKYDGYAGQEKLGTQSCHAPIVYLK